MFAFSLAEKTRKHGFQVQGEILPQRNMWRVIKDKQWLLLASIPTHLHPHTYNK